MTLMCAYNARKIAVYADPELVTNRIANRINAYVNGYELRPHNGSYIPNERELLLIRDAIMGLLADDDWNSEWNIRIHELASRCENHLYKRAI